MGVVLIDILEPNQLGGFRYVLAIQDYLTKLIIAGPLKKNITIKTVMHE